MQAMRIRCPKCDWEPDEGCRWICDACGTRWNTFNTHGQCPGCGKVFKDTGCSKSKGGCGQMSPNADWYDYNSLLTKKPSGFFSLWKKKDDLPVTKGDKLLVEESLVSLTELFDPFVFKSLKTIIPDKNNFDYYFTGGEEDAQYVLEKVASVMRINPWEIQLMFFSNSPTEFSDGTIATPQKELKGSWQSTNSDFVDQGLGRKEIWVELRQLKDAESLIATIAHELAKYKLSHEYEINETDKVLAEFTAAAFGFGIFMGNSAFKFTHWRSASHQGWQMQTRGHLPEPVIAYAMAWLAHYRNEDVGWKSYLNKTMKKYFEQCYDHIAQNKDKTRWE